MGLDAAGVIRVVDAKWGAACARCAEPIVGQEIVIGLLMGFQSSLCCVGCFAVQMQRERDEFVRHAAANVRRLACYRAGWNVADARLREAGQWPHPRIPADIVMPESGLDDDDDEDAADEVAADAFVPRADAEFDAAGMSCGDLVLELRLRLRELAPGATLRVRATDPGAIEDLPAWCRLTRHEMVRAAAPEFWIRRRTEV